MTPTTERLAGGRRANASNPPTTNSIPSLSVVTVVRNGEATLDACIQSVAAQTYPNVHHVIVDGASTDGTVDILRRYDATLEYWVSEPDKGIYNALNKAIALIRSSHYVVLGCDDLLMPSAAEALMKYANDSLIIFGIVKFDSPRSGEMHIRNHSGGTMINMEAHRLLGPYDETYKIAADTKFLTAARRAGITMDVDDIVGVFVAGGASAIYSNNVREHARAMHEAGAWGVLRSLAWKAPRLALAALRR
jgi:glycosyltransferase involved in cell wall biosynthesis